MTDRRLPGVLLRTWLRGSIAVWCLLAAAAPVQAQALTTNVTADLGSFSVGELQFSLVATGGNGTYTWDITAGALPPGVALRTDKPSWFPSNASAGLIGVPTVPGHYPFTIRVRSGALEVSQATGITITSFNINEQGQLPDGFTGTAYSHQLTSLNNTGAVTWSQVGAWPAGLTMNATGLISGTPAAGFYNFTYSANDGTNTIFRGASLRVWGIHILGDVLPNAIPNQPYGPVTIGRSGGNGNYTFTGSVGLPSGLSMSSTGVISGTPTANPGRYGFGVSVADTGGAAGQKSLAIFVDTSPAHLPYLQPYGSNFEDCTIGIFCLQGIGLNNGGAAPFVVSGSGLPAAVAAIPGGTTGGSFVVPGDIEVAGVPTTTGGFSPQFQVTDVNGAVSKQTFPLKVSRLALRTDNTDAILGTPMSTALRIIGGTAPYHATLIRGPLPAGVSFDTTTLTIGGTPAEAGGFGPQFDITDNNGETLRVHYYFTVRNAVPGVSINNFWDLGSISSGSFYSNQLSACCTAVTWSVIGGVLPPGFTLSSGGLLSGSSSTIGTYTFLVKATDSGNASRFDIRQFQFVVTPVAIQTGTDLPNGFVGSPYSQDLSATGGPGPIAWTLDPATYLPPGLSLVQVTPALGRLSGTPTASGQFSFRLFAVDGTGIANWRYFRLSVFPAGATPTLNVTTGSNLGTWTIGEVEAQLFASGGTGIYNWQLLSGPLPPGVSVRQAPDLAPWFSSLASAGLIGVATTPGTYPFTLRVTSGSQTADVAFTMKISSLASVDNFSLPNAFAGESYSVTLTASGNAGPVTWAPNGALPPGLNLSSSGVLSGTPTTAGFYTVSFAMTDNNGTAFRGLGLSVFDLHITSAGALANAMLNVPYLAHIGVAGGVAPYHFDISGSLPSGLALDPSTGDISGTPTTTGLGRFTFTITVTDANHVSYSKTIAIVLIPGQPSVTNILPYGTEWDDCTFGVPCSRGISAFSGGKAPFTWTATGLPSGLSIRFGDATTFTPGDAEVFGLPRATGLFQVHVTMTDADGITVANDFPLRISALMQPDGITGGTINQPYSAHLRTIGGTLPYTNATIIDGALPAGVSFDAGTLNLGGTPQENGSFRFVLRLNDSGGNILKLSRSIFISGGTSTVNINTNDLGVAVVGQNFSAQAFACCLPNAFTWSLVSGLLPTGLSLSSDGIVSGIPEASNAIGPYKFLVKAADAINPANFAIRQLTVTVSNLSITSGNPPTGSVGTPYSFAFTATGGSGTRTWSLAPFQFLPQGLALDPSTGVLSGTPTGASLVSGTVRVTDTAGNFASRFFSIAIYPTGVYPPLNLSFGGSFVVQYGVFTFQITASSVSGGLGPYTLSLTPDAALPAGASQVPGLRVISDPAVNGFFGTTAIGAYAGVATIPGVYHPSIRLTDANGTFIDKLFTFTVVPFAVLSPTNIPKATRNVPYSYQLLPYASGANLSWQGTGMPAGLTLDPGTGLVSGTPTVAGATFFRVTLTDLNTGAALGLTFNITIDPFAIETSALLPVGTVATPYPLTFAAPGCGAPCNWTTTTNIGGLSLSSAGVLSGTPTNSFTGTITVTATGPNGTVSKLFSLFILPAATAALAVTTATIGDVTIGSSVALGASATGGTPPYNWALDSGTLPPGVWLATSGADYSANFGTGVPFLLGRAMQSATYNFTIRVTDHNGASATRAFTWNVSRLAYQSTILPLTGTTLVYNQAYTQGLLALGGTGNYPSWTKLSTDPPGLALNPTTGVVSGTPLNTGGFGGIPIRVSDGDGNAFTGNWTFNVAGPTATNLIFGVAALTLNPGAQFSQTITPTNGVAPYTITALSPLPPGVILGTAGDSIVGGPTAAGQIVLTGIGLTPGVYPLTLRAQDSATTPNIGVRTITITVLSAAVFTTGLPDASVGKPYSRTLLSFDSTGPTTWSLATGSALPPGLAIDLAGGAIVGTPTKTGTFSFVLNVSNAAGIVIARTYTLNVSGIFIQDDTILPTGTVGTPYSYALTATGGAGTVLWSAPSMPPGLSLSPNGAISGTPTSSGVFTFVATANDGVKPISRQLTVPIRLPIPSVLDISLGATSLSDVVLGSNLFVILGAGGGVPPHTWRLASGSTLPPGLQLLNANAASTSFVPGTMLIAGMPTTPGAYSFDLIATDAVGAEVRRTYTLNVTRIALLTGNIPTVITGTAYSTRFFATGGTGSYSFTMTPVNATLDMLPPGLNLSAAGQISGSTTSTGFYTFNLRVQDTAGNSITRSFSMQVTTPSGLQVQSTNPPNLWVGGGLNAEMDLGAGGPSTYTWTHTGGNLPPGLRIERGTIGGPNVTELVGAPTAAGTFTFTLRATDDVNPSNFAERVFTVRVAPMQLVSPPVSLLLTVSRELPSGHAGLPYSFTLKAAGGTAPYTFAQSPFQLLPPGLSLSSTGVVSGTTTLTGRFIVAPVITDASGRTLNSPTLGLTIAPAGAAPPLVRGIFEDMFGAAAGVPYAFPLDRLIRTGTGPYTWTVAPVAAPAVNALPPGMTIINGTNGVDSYLGGTPTTPGNYNFSLIVSDSSSPQQSLTVDISMTVSEIALTPDSLPPAKAGVPYSQTLVPSGGTGPYSVKLYPASDLPAGLTFSNGVISGTPSGAGNYLIVVMASDAAGHEQFKVYPLAVDNAAGEAPALGLSPKPIQVYYEIGSPNPAPIQVAVTTTTGAQPFTAALSSIPGVSLASGAGTTSTTVNLNLNVTSLGEGSYRGLLAVNAPGAANLIDSIPVSLTVARAPGCTFTVNPTGRSAPIAGDLNKTFSVGTAAACHWAATASDPWLTINAGASGTGNGVVNYSVAPNPGSTDRTGNISINGVTSYTISQFGAGCSYTINPTNLTATAAGGSAFVAVYTPVGCTWTSSSTDLTLGAAPIGKTGVTVIVPPNPGIGRVLTAAIAGQVFQVFQSGIECTATLSPYGATVPAGGSTGSVGIALPAACAYNTVLGPSWINVTSGATGAGTGTIVYSVEPNPTTTTRSGALTIGGQPFTITQDPLACSVTIDTSGLGSPYGSGGGTGTIGISANGANCSWSASSNAPWAVLAPTSGSGNTTLGVTTSANAASTTGRTAALTVAGQTVNVSQAGTTCTFELGSDTGSAPAVGGSGSVRVTAPTACPWSATSGAPWLAITASGTSGSSDVRFTAQANTSAIPRSGSLTVAGTPYTVNQAGAACSFTITGSPTSPTFASGGAGGQSVGFTSSIDGCTGPTPVSYASWIAVDASTFAARTGSVTYSVAANPLGTSRQGTIQIGSAVFTVVQSGAACAYSLNEYGRVFRAAGGDATVLGTPTAPACTPATGTDQPSFITLGPLAGPDLNIFSLPYTVAPFGTPLASEIRFGTIAFGGRVVFIKQYSW